MNRKVILRLFLIVLGIGLIIVAVFAFQIGLDNNSTWGTKRFQLIGVGLLLIIFSLSYWVLPVIYHFWPQKLVKKSLPRTINFPFLSALMRFSPKVGLFLLAILTVWIYVWIFTAGRVDKWPTGKNYYGLLAEAFQYGQLHLLMQPPATLLSLPNPYDYHQRENLDYLWDVSLYQGKYYLYWGPVPAVIGLIIRVFTYHSVSDSELTLFFVVLTSFWGIAALFQFSRDFDFPGWLFWGAALGLALNVPALWLLTRPLIYEASIAGGQAFGMAGSFFSYRIFRSKNVGHLDIILTGLLLGLAAGSRTSLLISGVVLGVILVGYLLRNYSYPSCQLFSRLLALVLPLGGIFFALLAYNYARFGSIVETGHRYQLTGPALPPDYKDVISLAYALPNFFTYIFRLPALQNQFPFITIPWVKETMWPGFIHLPVHYYTERTAGILFIVPLLGFSAILLLSWVWRWLNGDVRFELVVNSRQFLLRWWGVYLLCYVSIPAIVLLLFISSSLRYLFDITPSLILLSALFVGSQYGKLATTPFHAGFLRAGWITMAILSAISSVFVGISGYSHHFAEINPVLYQQLASWFYIP